MDAKATIGESPAWLPQQNALYWIDVKAPALYRTSVDSFATNGWPLPSDIGGFALTADLNGAVVALRTGVHHLDLRTGSLRQLCAAPFDPVSHRFNEADCDARGRLWIGTMFDPSPAAHCTPAKQYLYSFTFEDGLVRHDDTALLHNGFAWSADGDEFFIAHSREGRIYACGFDIENGRIGPRRVFAEIPHGLGIPDGGAFDAEGCYWCAIHEGGRLHRYRPDGMLDTVVEVPSRHPTMIAFGGADLRDLYITTATHGKPGEPHEGGLFRLRVDVAGLPRRAQLT